MSDRPFCDLTKKRENKFMTVATKIPQAYAEIVEFLAADTTPESIINFQLSEEAKEHIADLIYQHNNEGLTREEKSELDRYLLL